MSETHGKDSIFKMGNESDSMTDYSAQITKIGFKPSRKNSESTAMGATAKSRVPGQVDSTISIEGWFDNASGKIDKALFKARGRSKAVQVGPDGSGSGAQRITGNFILTSYNLKPSVDGVVPFTATFVQAGAYTKDTF